VGNVLVAPAIAAWHSVAKTSGEDAII